MTRRRQILLAVAAVVVLVAAVLVVTTNNDTPAASGGIASDRKTTIDAGGVSLAAEVITPNGKDKPPLVLMPAGWGAPATQYQQIGRDLADDGYLVVAYAQRGFGGSGGAVDFAGANTQADAKRVLDWALRNTDADEKHIGMYGMSYGGGISLLAAAKDPRIKAVAALSTWSDLATSYDPNGTPGTRALGTLLGTGSDRSEDTTVRSLRSLLKKDPQAVGERITQLSPTRSPMSYVSQLNTNKTAIMLGNGYQDSLFGPEQLVSFYDALKTPKRLQLEAGDHGGPEAPALSGSRTRVTSSARAWLDHFLRDDDNGIDREPPIVLADAKTGVLHSMRTWPRATGSAVIPLGKPGSTEQTGTRRATTWTSTIVAGADTAATSGPQVSVFGKYSVPKADLLTLSKELAFFWTGGAFGQPTPIGGTPRATLNLAATKSRATVVAYLYDVAADGKGSLLSVQPYTLTGLKSKQPRTVTIDMQPIAWTMSAGHHLVLAVDTQDSRYTGFNTTGEKITASATTSSPATLSVPLLK